jgi:hypothetical protein
VPTKPSGPAPLPDHSDLFWVREPLIVICAPHSGCRVRHEHARAMTERIGTNTVAAATTFLGFMGIAPVTSLPERRPGSTESYNGWVVLVERVASILERDTLL